MTRSARHLRPLAVLLAAVLALLVVASPFATAPPVEAAVTGAGYAGITPYGGYLGNYIAPDGTRVYCMDSARDWPSGTTDAGTIVGSVPTQSGQWLPETTVRKLNYAMLRWGQTDNPTIAAAVSAYVYAYTSTIAQNSGPGYHAGLHYINGNAAVTAAYNTVWSASESHYAGSAKPSASLKVTLSGWDGSVRVSVTPATARGTLTLSGAVVAGTRNRQVAVGNGSLVPIRAVVADGDATASVSASATFTIDNGAGASLVVYQTGSQQRTLRGAFPETVTTSASGRATSSVAFSPIVQTKVASRYVDPGQPFVDGLTVSLADGSPEWRRLTDGSAMPVFATGTLYGPFTQQPAVASVPPEGVPVVGSETITLTGTGEYESSGTLLAPSPGFYTWVWSIEASAQPEHLARMLPQDYSFADQFGLVAESHVVPMKLAAVSQVSSSEVGLGGEINDELSVSLVTGPWLTEAGVPIPARFTGTAYFVAGDTAPVESDSVPSGAEVIGTAEVIAREPGIYAASTPVTAPERVGYVTWVWQLDASSPSAPYFEPWSDRFGMPTETTRVLAPTVSTVAMPTSVVGDEVQDSAIVGGHLPAEPGTLVFRAYLQPATADEPVCDASTLAYDSSSNPVTVTGAGTYDSPPTRFEKHGKYYWVESFYSNNGTLVHTGECGLEEETTLVSPGTIVTHSSAVIEPGAKARDTASVTGTMPEGLVLVFRAFAQHGVIDGPLCDESTLVFTSKEVPLDGPGRYTSESTRFDRPGTYFWVETLYDEHGNPLHVGECGIPTETTEVREGTLARTGLPMGWSLGIATLLLGLGTGVLVAVRRSILDSQRREYTS